MRDLTKYVVTLERETSEGGDGKWTATTYDGVETFSARGSSRTTATHRLFSQTKENPEEIENENK